MYFNACAVTDEAKQRGIFLASVGKQTYPLVKNLLEFGKCPKDKITKNWLTWLVNIKILHHHGKRNIWKSSIVIVDRMRLCPNMWPPCDSTCQFSSGDFENQTPDRLMHSMQNNKMQIEMINVGTEIKLKTAMNAAMRVEHSRRSVKKIKHFSKVGQSHHAGEGSQSGVMGRSCEVNEVYDQRDEENECVESYSLHTIGDHCCWNDEI